MPDDSHLPSIVTIEAARALYGQGGSAHDFDHVLRVLKLAERIGPAEGADMVVLRTACLLHDVARGKSDRAGACHAQAGAQEARRILAGQPAQTIEAIAHAIAAHRFRGAVQPETLEAQVLSDADKLDAIGAIGVARAYAIAGEDGQRLWATVRREDFPDIHSIPTDVHTPVHEYVFKLSALPERLYTRTARTIAAGRRQFMELFFDELEREIAGVA